MGLLTKEVEIKLEAQNIKYYENLGYEIPRYYNEISRKYKVKQGTTLMVKIQDLPKGSHMFVDLICDGCGKELKRTYYDYNKRNYDGKVYCFHCAHKILNSRENNCNWNPNLTDDERRKFRKYPEYIQFVKSVLARDNYTCQCCGKTNTSELDVHHLYAYADFPQYRIDQTQAITLCKCCHKAFHSWYIENFGYTNKGKCTKSDYEQWIGYVLDELSTYSGNLCTTKKVYDYETGVIYDKAEDCARELNTNTDAIYKCCNHTEIIARRKLKNGTMKISKTLRRTVKGHHLFWLHEYNSLTENEIFDYLNSKSNTINSYNHLKVPKSICKKVICLTTGEIFEKIKDGSEKYGLKSSSKIGENCKGVIKSAGKLSDGTRLVWMYYEDFLLLSETEQNEILSKNKND